MQTRNSINYNKDYYSILGVSKKATDHEIKTAYRNLVKKCHPDIFNNSDLSETEKQNIENRFRDVTEAYEVLSDPVKKADYNLSSPFAKIDEKPENNRDTYNGPFGSDEDPDFQTVTEYNEPKEEYREKPDHEEAPQENATVSSDTGPGSFIGMAMILMMMLAMLSVFPRMISQTVEPTAPTQHSVSRGYETPETTAAAPEIAETEIKTTDTENVQNEQNDSEIVEDTAINHIFSLVLLIFRVIGMMTMIWGLFNTVIARKEDDASAISGGISRIVTGMMMLLTPTIISSLGIM